MKLGGHVRAASCALVLLLGVLPGRPAESFDEALYARLIARYTQSVADPAGTRVDYEGLAGSPDWRRLVQGLAASRPATLRTRQEKLAFWINAYNVLAIDLVVRHYPVSSIRDIGSWLRPVFHLEAGRIGGQRTTLERIEDGILRPLGDPRIHAAIVCASVSCPSLRREPFTAARLDAQLDDSLRRWLSDPHKGARIDAHSRIVYLSSVFRWFEKDFANHGGVLAFVRPYLAESDASWVNAHEPEIELRYLSYDWSLNGIATGGGSVESRGRAEVDSVPVSCAAPEQADASSHRRGAACVFRRKGAPDEEGGG